MGKYFRPPSGHNPPHTWCTIKLNVHKSVMFLFGVVALTRKFLLLTFFTSTDVIIKLAQNSIPHMLNGSPTCT